MISSAFENITPEIAKEYLKNNSRNRPVKPSTVETYARDMLKGKFITTHQGIGFDTNGSLCDGQHRLLAIVASGKAQTMMVSRGMSPDATLVIDRGTTRTIRDILTLESKNNPSSRAKMRANQRVISALSQLAAHNCGTKRMKLSTSDVVDLFNGFKGAVEQVYANIITKSGISARAPMLSAAIAAVDCGVDIDAVSKFFCIVFRDDVTGCENYNINAALNWKRQIDSAKAARVYIDGRRLYLGTQNALYHFVNATGVSRIVAPAESRYDVSEKICGILGLEKN